MKKRTFIIAALLAFGIVGFFQKADVKANPASTLKSNGRIMHNNGTPDTTADDVVLFDAEDLKTLETKLAELEVRMTAAGEKIN